MISNRQLKYFLFVLQTDAFAQGTYLDLSLSFEHPSEDRKEDRTESQMSMGSFCFAKEVDGRCYLLDEEGDKMIAVFEKVQEEIEIVLSIKNSHTSKCRGLR